MKTNSLRFGLFATCVAVFACSVSFAAPPFQSAIGDPNNWTATKWSKEDTARFAGMPTTNGREIRSILVRYTYYVSDYDLENRGPLWVAHTVGKDSELKARGRGRALCMRWDSGKR